MSSQQRDPRTFSSIGDEDIEEWVDFYTRVSLHSRLDCCTKLEIVVFYLTDVAKTWFLNHEAEMTLWQAFSHLHEVFGCPEDRCLQEIECPNPVTIRGLHFPHRRHFDFV